MDLSIRFHSLTFDHVTEFFFPNGARMYGYWD